VLHLLQLWRPHIIEAPALVPAVVRMLLPLVQQLQSCGPQLLEAAAAAAAGSAYQQDCASMLQTTFLGVQHTASELLFELDPVDNGITVNLSLPDDVTQQVQQGLDDPAVVELLLQDLISSTAALQQYHAANRQQQQQQQQQQRHTLAGHSSSSKSTSSSSAAGSSEIPNLELLPQHAQQQPVHSIKQQLRADLLAIPAYHRSMLHLLAGGQAYLDAGRAAVTGWNMSEEEHLVWCRSHAGGCCYALYRYLLRSVGKPAEQQQDALLSAAGVQLVLELQLVAAAETQRWQQQQQQVPGKEDLAKLTAVQLSSSTQLLHMLIRAVAQASGSCLPPEVLQQAGLQLLQALAAPLQQLQLSGAGRLVRYAATLSWVGVRGQMGWCERAHG
jgi:hypothetical protein